MHIQTARYVSGDELFKDCDEALQCFLDAQLCDPENTLNDIADFSGLLLGSMTALVAVLADAISLNSDHDEFSQECKVVLARIEALGEVHYFVLNE